MTDKHPEGTDPVEPPVSTGPAFAGPPEPPGGAGAPDDGGVPPSRKRWIVAAMAALGVALFTLPLFRSGGEPPAGSSSGPPATAATDGGAGTCATDEGPAKLDVTMKDINGADVRLSDYKGKVILLNFWATWCGPCKVEIPEFVEVYDEYKDRGFEILGVLAMDEPSPEDLRAFADQYKMSYPVLRADDEFSNSYGVWALPTSLIIDRQGSICRKHIGPLSRDTLEREIKGLL